jgi:CBS domain-containing protein
VTWATRVAAGVGGAIGLGLIVLGIVGAISGNVVGGMWSVLIGLFIRSAAAASSQQTVARHMLQGIPVARLMVRDPVTVAPGAPVGHAVELFLANNLKFLPVVEGGRPVGHIGLRQVKALPAAVRMERPVAEAMTPLAPESSIGPREDAGAALAQMQRTGLTRLLVVEDGRLAGVICLKDLLDQLTLRSELELREEVARP